MSSFLWVRCPEAATWQPVKEMAKRHPHKWDMEADGTLIAVLFTAVEVLPRCYIEVRDTFLRVAAETNRHLLKKSCGQYLCPEKRISGRIVFFIDKINIFSLSWARLHFGWFAKDIRGWKSAGRKAIHQKGLPRPLTFLYACTESPDMVLPETVTTQDRSIRRMQPAVSWRLYVEQKQPGAAGEIHPQ